MAKSWTAQIGHFKYKVLINDESNLKFEIVNSQNLDLPKTLFRYYSLSPRALSVLDEKKFFISQPDEFNDLFDGHFITLNFQNIHFDEVKAFYKGVIPDEELMKEWTVNRVNLLNKVGINYYNILLSKFGIICMSNNIKNELLWAYYNNHMGFCIEYDYKVFPKNFRGPFPVNYVKKLEKIDVNKYGGPLTFLLHNTIKKDIWQHEIEYRFLVESSGNPYKVGGMFSNDTIDLPYKDRFETYPIESIKSLILGFRFLQNETAETMDVNILNVEFTSKDKDLKSKLFDFIIENKIICKSITVGIVDLSIDFEIWEISKIEINTYLVKVISQQLN